MAAADLGPPPVSDGPADPWSRVPGQPAAVAQLRAAIASPVHAYLLVGPRGSGKRAAAAAFGGELLAAADLRAARDAQRARRHRRLAAREEHPDMFVLDPSGNQLRRGAEVAALVAEASRVPVEGRRKVLVVNRFHTAHPAAAASLLKPVEEPSESTVWVLLTEQVLPEHVTIASRCLRVDFTAVADADVAAVLADEGLAAGQEASLAAAAAGGNLDRARVLAADQQVQARREAWWTIPERLDGAGATAAALVDEVRSLITAASEPLAARHRQELAGLAEREKMFGTRGSGRSDTEARHRRELRQLRTDELRFGLATLASRYREMMVDGWNAQAMSAIDRLRRTSAALSRNPNEALALQALLLDLPPAPRARAAGG